MQKATMGSAASSTMDADVIIEEWSNTNSASIPVVSASTTVKSMPTNFSETLEECGHAKPVAKQKNLDYIWSDPIETVAKDLQSQLNFLNAQTDLNTTECAAASKFVAKSTVFTTAENKDRRVGFVVIIAQSDFVSFFLNALTRHFRDDLLHDNNKSLFGVVRDLILVMWNGTDSSQMLCDKLAAQNGLETILRSLNHDMLQPQELENPKVIYITKGFLGILHNCLQKLDCREKLRSKNAVNIISKFRASKNLMVKCKAEFDLSYLLNEKENEQLNANAENIKYMESILSAAMKHKSHYSKKYGYAAHEVIAALNRLASNDGNKYKMADVGLLQHYVELLNPESANETEYVLAAKGLWILSFKLSEQITQEEGSITGLSHSLY